MEKKHKAHKIRSRIIFEIFNFLEMSIKFKFRYKLKKKSVEKVLIKQMCNYIIQKEEISARKLGGIKEIIVDAEVISLLDLQEGKHLLVGLSNGEIKYYSNINLGEKNLGEYQEFTLTEHNSKLIYALCCIDSNYFASGEGYSECGLAVLWQYSHKKKKRNFGSPIKINSFQLQNEGVRMFKALKPNLLACGMFNGKILLWNIIQNSIVNELVMHSDQVSCLLSIDNYCDRRLLFSGSWDKSIVVWDLNTKELFKGGQFASEHNNDINALVRFSGDYRILSSSSDCTVKLWQISSSNSLKTFKLHNSYIFDIYYYNDIDVIVTGGYDNCIKIFDLADRESFVESKIVNEKNMLNIIKTKEAVNGLIVLRKLLTYVTYDYNCQKISIYTLK